MANKRHLLRERPTKLQRQMMMMTFVALKGHLLVLIKLKATLNNERTDSWTEDGPMTV